ncbi:MAG: response regulator transcription factor [Acidimicrobiia bacterium]
MRVVITDDHGIVREGIRWMLADSDVDIVGEADSGEALLDLLATEAADVVLLDLRMPGIGGLEALRRIRRDHPMVRVLMLTMHDRPTHVREAMALGAAGYLLKQTGRDELLRALAVVHDGGVYLHGDVAAAVTEADGTAGGLLSPRETEVLQLVARGYENKQVARALGIGEATVKTYLSDAFERLGASGRAEAVAIGLRLGLID